VEDGATKSGGGVYRCGRWKYYGFVRGRNFIAMGVVWGAAITLAAIFMAGCGDPAPKTDAQLGLNAQQASGRQVFDHYCGACHNAYSSSGSKGPSLKGLYKKQFLPSGLPANDRFVEQTIVNGRGMMPPQGDALDQQQLDDLVAYLHTL
jgi:mono/diheme cytochrome c family protein